MSGPPPIKEGAKLKGGDDQRVFNSLARESKNTAEEVGDPTCNIVDSADSEPFTVRLSPFPTVSCRITPTGETILSFQWEPQVSETNQLASVGVLLSLTPFTRGCPEFKNKMKWMCDCFGGCIPSYAALLIYRIWSGCLL